MIMDSRIARAALLLTAPLQVIASPSSHNWSADGDASSFDGFNPLVLLAFGAAWWIVVKTRIGGDIEEAVGKPAAIIGIGFVLAFIVGWALR